MDPVIFDVVGPIKLRWYGTGYLLGFVLGFYLLKFLAKRKLWVLGEDKVADFIAYAAVFGVFVGGRVGYILFYQIPKKGGWDELVADPWMVFKVWDGGMSSHGGILGLMIFTFVYARMHKVSWTGVGDSLCVVAPIGIGLVRCANFINGELYGRAAQGVSWAMKFPSSLHEDWKDKPEMITQAYDACRYVDPTLDGQPYEYLVARARENPELQETLGNYLQARHPSQLYEALLEGLVLFAILIFTRLKFPQLPRGILTGMFFFFYAVFRIIVENYREPDLGQALVLSLTKGQFYSVFMIIAGVAFMANAVMRKKAL